MEPVPAGLLAFGLMLWLLNRFKTNNAAKLNYVRPTTTWTLWSFVAAAVVALVAGWFALALRLPVVLTAIVFCLSGYVAALGLREKDHLGRARVPARVVHDRGGFSISRGAAITAVGAAAFVFYALVNAGTG